MAPRPERIAFFLPLPHFLFELVVMDDDSEIGITPNVRLDPDSLAYIASGVFVATPMTSNPMLSLWRPMAGKFLFVDANTLRLWKLNGHDLVFVLRQLTTKAHVRDFLRRLWSKLNDLIVVKHTQQRDQEANVAL